jgi:hypothetical protein
VAWIFIEVFILVGPEVIARNSVRLWVLDLSVSRFFFLLTFVPVLLGVSAIIDIFKKYSWNNTGIRSPGWCLLRCSDLHGDRWDLPFVARFLHQTLEIGIWVRT